MINCIGEVACQLTEINRMFGATIGETYAHVLELLKRRLSND